MVCISPRFAVSEACNKEVSLADMLRKPIVPVMIERTPWPPPGPLALLLSQYVYIDLVGTGGHGGCGKDADWSAKMRELVKRLRLYTNPPAPIVVKSMPIEDDVVEAVEIAEVGGGAPGGGDGADPVVDRQPSRQSEATSGNNGDDGNQSWGQGDPGSLVVGPPARVPCCVNVFSYPSRCAIL